MAPTRLLRPRAAAALSATGGVLIVVALVQWALPPRSMVVVGPVATGVLLLLTRRAGLTAEDLGLARGSWKTGACYGAACVAVVSVIYGVAVLIPAVRSAFLDERYRSDLPTGALTAFVLIPLGTILFEEIAFRGVLWGLLQPHPGRAWATLASSVLFGLWHVVPSMHLNEANPAVADLAGPGRTGQMLTVASAVLFTALAGVLLCELRRLSGSLLAPVGLHWATNGLGVLISSVVA